MEVDSNFLEPLSAYTRATITKQQPADISTIDKMSMLCDAINYVEGIKPDDIPNIKQDVSYAVLHASEANQSALRNSMQISNIESQLAIIQTQLLNMQEDIKTLQAKIKTTADTTTQSTPPTTSTTTDDDDTTTVLVMQQ